MWCNWENWNIPDLSLNPLQIRILFTTVAVVVVSKKNVVCCGRSCPRILEGEACRNENLPLRKCEVCCFFSSAHPTSHEVENYGTSYPINSLLAKIVGPEPMGNQHLPRFLERRSQWPQPSQLTFLGRNYHPSHFPLLEIQYSRKYLSIYPKLTICRWMLANIWHGSSKLLDDFCLSSRIENLLQVLLRDLWWVKKSNYFYPCLFTQALELYRAN